MTRPDIHRACQAERREAEARPPAPPPASPVPWCPADQLGQLAALLMQDAARE